MMCTWNDTPHRRELCNKASAWMWIWTLGLFAPGQAAFLLRSVFFFFFFGGDFSPQGRREVSFSSELCSLNRKQCGSKERCISPRHPPPSPQKTLNDMEICARSTMSAKNEIMSGSCRSWRGHSDTVNKTVNGSNFLHNISGCDH